MISLKFVLFLLCFVVELAGNLSECQHNVGNHICTNRFYYSNYKNGSENPINHIIERHFASIFLSKCKSNSKSKSKSRRNCRLNCCIDSNSNSINENSNDNASINCIDSNRKSRQSRKSSKHVTLVAKLLKLVELIAKVVLSLGDYIVKPKILILILACLAKL